MRNCPILRVNLYTSCDCSWQDESNGEIYNDRDASAANAAPIDPEALYVVENGKEYPLASVSKRRSLFVSQARITKLLLGDPWR